LRFNAKCVSTDPLFDDEQDGPTLGFEAWMDLSMQLLRRSEGERAAILDRARVSIADWEASDAHWTGVLSDEVSRGDTTRAEAYGARCAAAFRQRAAEPRSEDTGADREPDEAPSREPALPSPNQDAAVVQAFAAKAPPRSEVAASVEPAAAFASDPLPDVRLPLGPVHIPEAPAVATPPHLSFAEPPKPSFVEPPKPSFMASAVQGAEPLGKAPHPGGMTLDALPVPADLKPLPFTPRPAGAEPVFPPSEPAPGPAARKPQSPLGETAMALDLPIGPATPFAGASPPPKREVMAAGGLELPMITVEQYAALCAELSLGKSTLERALVRQGIHDAAVWSALDRSWQDRFRSDPDLRRRWSDLTAQYREFLKNHAL